MSKQQSRSARSVFQEISELSSLVREAKNGALHLVVQDDFNDEGLQALSDALDAAHAIGNRLYLRFSAMAKEEESAALDVPRDQLIEDVVAREIAKAGI